MVIANIIKVDIKTKLINNLAGNVVIKFTPIQCYSTDFLEIWWKMRNMMDFDEKWQIWQIFDENEILWHKMIKFEKFWVNVVKIWWKNICNENVFLNDELKWFLMWNDTILCNLMEKVVLFLDPTNLKVHLKWRMPHIFNILYELGQKTQFIIIATGVYNQTNIECYTFILMTAFYICHWYNYLLQIRLLVRIQFMIYWQSILILMSMN